MAVANDLGGGGGNLLKRLYGCLGFVLLALFALAMVFPASPLRWLFTVLAVAAIAVAVWALSTRSAAPAPAPRLTPKPTPTEEPLTNTIALPQFAWLNLSADTTEQTLTFDNPQRNFAHFRVSLVLDGETLWESEMLAPGKTSKPVTLSRPLAAGEYQIELCYACFADAEGTSPLNGARSPVRLVVE